MIGEGSINLNIVEWFTAEIKMQTHIEIEVVVNDWFGGVAEVRVYEK